MPNYEYTPNQIDSATVVFPAALHSLSIRLRHCYKLFSSDLVTQLMPHAVRLTTEMIVKKKSSPYSTQTYNQQKYKKSYEHFCCNVL